jgi:hypothetical protein
VKSRLATWLILLTAFTVAGGHVAVMQVSAWILMSRDSAGSSESLPQIVSAFLSGSRPCERCLFTVASAVPGGGDDQDASVLVIPELKLLPVNLGAIRISPPSQSGRRPIGESDQIFERRCLAPPTPPPELA